MDAKEWNDDWKLDGRPTPKTCPACSRNWPQTANVCGICGVKLVEKNKKGENNGNHKRQN